MSRLAVVTGASSGIGESFAKHLADIGYDLLLIARRRDRLETLATSLAEKHRVKTEVMQADLSDTLAITRVAEELERREVEMLVNNAGFGIGKDFHEIDYEKTEDMIQVHVLATTFLCRAVLPGMIARNQGIIINVASVASFIHMPGSSTYPGAKAYIAAFSESIQRNVLKTKIKVQALCPGYTITEFHDAAAYKKLRPASPTAMWMTADRVVQASLSKLSSKKVVYVPGWRYRLIIALLQCPLIGPILWKIVLWKRHQ